jgi:hypothetical protein
MEGADLADRMAIVTAPVRLKFIRTDYQKLHVDSKDYAPESRSWLANISVNQCKRSRSLAVYEPQRDRKSTLVSEAQMVVPRPVENVTPEAVHDTLPKESLKTSIVV